MKLCKQLFGWRLILYDPDYIQNIGPDKTGKENEKLLSFRGGTYGGIFEHADGPD